MGIPAYFSSIIKRYPCIIKKYNSSIIVNQLFMDCNSIIYDCFHNIAKENNDKSQNEIEKVLINNVIKKLDYYLKKIGGKSINFLAFDGVAPVAKMNQQKTRRYKSKYEKELLENKYNIISKEQWNTSSITPGTLFMKKLERELMKHYNNYSNVIVEFSNPGEGEHKIFDYIRSHKLKENTIIYGLDSDLIMLSLQNTQYCDSIYLYREMPEFIASIDSSLKPHDMYMVDIMEFKEKLTYYLNDEVIPVHESHGDRRIADYIFICFLLGNDFLPHFPSINLRRNGMDFIMESYVYAIGKTQEYIVNESNNINWKIFRKMINEMSKHESIYMKDEYKNRNKLSNRFFQQNTEEEKKMHFLNQPIIYREKESYINPEEDYWQGRYYYALFDINSQEMSDDNYCNKIKDICINYLEGLEWTFKYYSKGCIDWKWHYKYHYPPLLNDLKKYIPYFDEILVDEKLKNPVSDVVQLSYVLPLDHTLWNNILHTQTKNKLIQAYKDFDMQNNVPHIEWSFCRYFWEGHVVFDNYPSVQELQKSIT
jgi:5'-3' exonuclease